MLSQQSLSEVQKRNSKFYEVGDQVTFNPYTREQSHYRVIAKNGDMLELENKEGVCQLLKLGEVMPTFAVTKTKTMEFSINDSIVAAKNIYLGRAGKIEQGTVFSVEEIHESGLTLTHNKGY